MEITPTTDPLVSSRYGSANFVQFTVPQKLTSIREWITLRSRSLNIARIEMPALLTRMSMRPKRATVASTRARQSSSRVTSHWTQSTRSAGATDGASSSSLPRDRAAITTRAPSLPN